MSFFRGLILAAAACLAGSLACGPKGGRVDVHTTTKAERDSSGMYTGDIAAASDRVAQAMVADMQRLVDEEFADPNVRAWVVFGDIDNKTQTMPRSDFEYLRTRTKDKLQKSRIWRDNVKYVASRQQVEALNEREYGTGGGDVLQEGRGGGGTGVERPDRQHMYFLNGEAYGVMRGTTELYYVSFNLTRSTDGAEIFSQEYEVKYEHE
jgi:hypothetical protein